MRNFAHRGKETPRWIVIKFCMSVDIQDLITCATFGDDQLGGLGEARGRISHFPTDLRRRYTVRVCDMEVRQYCILYTARATQASSP